MAQYGIITFHDTLNFGASMQSYALQKKMMDMGKDVEVINYKCPRFQKEYAVTYVEEFTFKKIIEMILKLPISISKQRKKSLFQKKYMRLSEPYFPETIQSANEKYTGFITGSDQVWNWHLTDFDKAYFLDFVSDEKEKYSYAASFGVSEIESDKQHTYKELLNDFSAVSVRETSAMDIVYNLVGKRTENVVDPVLLLTEQEWRNVAKKAPISGYVLLYSINDTCAYECARLLAKNTNKKLVYLAAPVKRFGNFRKVNKIGPSEFVGWFDGADYVVTDSFHGTVTSIIFKKQFVSLQSRRMVLNTNSRIFDLLNKLKLADRVINSTNQLDVIFQKIDYVCVSKVLEEWKEKSVQFLCKITGEENA